MRSSIAILILFLFNYCGITQQYELVGLVEDKFIKIDVDGPAYELVGTLNPTPEDPIRFLTYVQNECMFYGIMDSGEDPTLVSIDLDLNLTVIGELSLPGFTIYFSEGFSYNDVDDILYAAVSLNGNIAMGDYESESILEVNRSNGSCTIKTEIIDNVAKPDIDRMTFFNNSLYFMDGRPGFWSKFFELEFLGLGATSQPTEKSSVSYIPVRDLEYYDGNVYYTTGRDLSFYNINSYSFTDLGQVFSTTELDGEELLGIGVNPFPDFLTLPDSLKFCESQFEINLELEYPYNDITWSDGTQSISLTISQPGTYWADVVYNGCNFRSDSIIVTIVDSLEIEVPQDTVICSNESIIIALEVEDAAVEWNDGTTGNIIEISEEGIYFAEYEKEGCIFFTDSINVEVIEGDYSIGSDIILCGDESTSLTIPEVGGDVIWSDGTIGNTIFIESEGLYWTDVYINGCVFRSDSIVVTKQESLEIDIGSDTLICEGETLIISIDDPVTFIVWSDGSTGDQIEINEPGFYFAEYVIGGCTFYTDTIGVEFIEAEFNLGPDASFCEGESHTIMLDGVTSNVSWSNGDIGNPLIVTEPGLYWAEVNWNGCTILTDTIEVFTTRPLGFNFVTDTVICDGQVITISTNDINFDLTWNNGTIGSDIEINGPGQYFGQYQLDGCIFYTDTINVETVNEIVSLGEDIVICEGDVYNLSLEGLGQEIIWNTGDMGSVLELTEAGEYFAMVSLDECSIGTDTILVELIPLEIIEIGSDTIVCGQQELVLEVQDGSKDYEWSTGEEGSSIVVEEAGAYWVNLINSECPSSSDTIEVRFIDDPLVTFEVDTTLCIDDELIFPQSEYGINWQNDTEDQLISTFESDVFWGNYYVEECNFKTDTISVHFVDCTPCSYYLPNIISANNDRINDVFEVVFSSTCIIEAIEIKVFDRWGNLIHLSNDNFWDGTMNGNPVMVGVYGYVIKIGNKTYEGNVEEFILYGDVTVVR